MALVPHTPALKQTRTLGGLYQPNTLICSAGNLGHLLTALRINFHARSAYCLGARTLSQNAKITLQAKDGLHLQL